MHYFSIFFKKFNKPCVNFSRVWAKNTNFGNFEKFSKIFDKNSIGKFSEFLTIFGKVVAKNRAFGNTIIFLLQFFPFRGGDVPYVPI